MGRAKMNMELIAKEKSRNVTFRKRKEGLIRKMHEFSTLCDVDACIIIYGPRNEQGQIEPEIWPQDLDKIKRIIGVYKSKKKDSGSKSFGLSDFFHYRNRKIEQDLTRLKRKNLASKYPSWPDFLNFKTESELRALSAALTDKSEHVKARIDFLKRKGQGYDGNMVDFRSSQSHSAGPNFYAPRVGGVELDLIYQQAISSMHVRQEILHSVNQNSMMVNDESGRAVQFEGGASALFNQQIFYEPKSEIVDPLLCLNTRLVGRSHGPQALPPFMHVEQEMAPPPPQMHFSNHDEDYV